MRKRYFRLTDQQDNVVQILRGSPGTWMTPQSIWEKIHPGEDSQTGAASVGFSLRSLPDKMRNIQAEQHGRDRVYRFVEMNPETEIRTDNGNSLLAQVQDSSMDAEILKNALLQYSVGILGSNPGRALRAAFLAGRETRSPVRSQRTSPKKDTVEGATEDEFQPGAMMPPTMTYSEMVVKAATAYADQEFTYEEAARRAQMSEDYLRRILTGDATPTRATQERVYSAVFKD